MENSNFEVKEVELSSNQDYLSPLEQVMLGSSTEVVIDGKITDVIEDNIISLIEEGGSRTILTPSGMLSGKKDRIQTEEARGAGGIKATIGLVIFGNEQWNYSLHNDKAIFVLLPGGLDRNGLISSFRVGLWRKGEIIDLPQNPGEDLPLRSPYKEIIECTGIKDRVMHFRVKPEVKKYGRS